MDELAGWIGSFDAYRSGGGKDRPHWLSMHGARPVKVDRKTGNTLLYIPHAAVSVTGGIQPQTLQRIMTSEFFESGFMSRVLFAMPPNPVRQWNDADIAPDRLAQLQSIMKRLLDLAAPDPDTGEIICKNIPLSPEAKTVWISFFNQHATEQRQIMDESLTASWGKLEGYAARFALLDHLIRSVIEGPFSSFDHDRISLESMEVGIKLSRWFGREAQRVFGLFGKNNFAKEQADRELVRIIQSKSGRITVRDLMRSRKKDYPTANAAETALNSLVQKQMAQVETEQTARPARTPRSAMTPELVERIKTNKAAILTAIQFDWDRDTIPIMICPKCDGWRHWQSMAGTWHCVRCDPPTVGLAWLKRVKRTRKRHNQPILDETRGLIAELVGLVDKM